MTCTETWALGARRARRLEYLVHAAVEPGLFLALEEREHGADDRRVARRGEAVHDGKHGPTFVSMVHRLHEQLAHCTVLHVDVSFGATAATSLAGQLDAAIGRTAHISFLENPAFLQMFVQTYLPYFI